jgi:hypothetical protein
MGKIGYGFGNEWHLLRFLGYHRDYLSKEVLNITGGKNISWVDFKFSRNAANLNNDRDLVGLEFIQNPGVSSAGNINWSPSPPQLLRNE